MLLDALGLVQVEVAEPEPGEGEHDGLASSTPELDDGRVDFVGLPPLGQPQDASGDDEVNDAHDVPEVQRRDLAAPSRPLERPSHEPAWELFDPDVRDIVPENLRPDDLPARGERLNVLGDHRNLR